MYLCNILMFWIGLGIHAFNYFNEIISICVFKGHICQVRVWCIVIMLAISSISPDGWCISQYCCWGSCAVLSMPCYIYRYCCGRQLKIIQRRIIYMWEQQMKWEAFLLLSHFNTSNNGIPFWGNGPHLLLLSHWSFIKKTWDTSSPSPYRCYMDMIQIELEMHVGLLIWVTCKSRWLQMIV